jgi:hypothetical protein
LAGIGIVVTAVGLGRAASIMIETADGNSALLRIGRLSLRVGLVALIAATVYVVAGPGFGAGHDHGLPDDLSVFDGVDRSRLPRDEALALATLAWSRPGSLDDDAGGDHGHPETMVAADLTQDQGKALASQLALAARAVPRYDTVEEITAAGYVQASNVSDGAGTHWVKWSLVDRPFDPETPSMLLFDELVRGEAPELIAFSYWVASPNVPEGFAGNTDQWHSHVGMCFQNGWLKDENIPDRRLCAGDWVNGSDLWMLHAWVVPGLENKLGQFAVVNPLLCERACGLEN